MKFTESSTNYTYPLPTVTLAYFLRYPNPYARHVLSSDVLSRHVDPGNARLHTTRLHLKKSKVPSAIMRFLPTGLAGPGGSSQSFILEESTIDLNEGWMETESRNMEWTGILSVVEKQVYRRYEANIGDDGKVLDWTNCKTTVTFTSKLGQAKALKKRTLPEEREEVEGVPKQGFFAQWGAAGIQRTVELVGVKRTQTALVNGAKGMNVVLERVRDGGWRGVLQGVRDDGFAVEGGWKGVWNKGQPGDDE